MPLPPAKKKAKRPRNPFKPAGPVINDFSISKVKPGVVWTVSSNGQIYNTMDGGKHWNNVSNITGAPPHTQFHTIEAGDEVNTAYVTARIAVKHGHKVTPTTHPKTGVPPHARLHQTTPPVHQDIDVPLIWRTTDGGKTWVSIVRGLPRNQRTGNWVNVLRVDPEQPGLLFVGTGTTVYVSFDNGDHWQSLRQIAAHARAIRSSSVYFFKPEEAIRARFNSNWDQPFSIEVPHAPNPPYGVIMDYVLRHKPDGPIQLQIFNAHGDLVRTLSSTLPPPIEGQAYPRYWLASPQSRALTTQVGLNRFAWNLRYAPPLAFHHDLENQMNNVAGTTTPGPHGPQVIPGVYTLKLTVDGHVYTRHVTVMNDPRVGQSPRLMAALRAQNRVTMFAYHGMRQTYEGHQEVNAVKTQLASLMHGHLPAPLALQAKKLEASLTKIGGKKPTSGFLSFLHHLKHKPKALRSFVALNNDYNNLVSLMQVGLDMRPTPDQVATLKSDCRQYDRTVTAWKAMQAKQLPAFNTVLAKNHLKKLHLVPVRLAEPSCSVAAGLH